MHSLTRHLFFNFQFLLSFCNFLIFYYKAENIHQRFQCKLDLSATERQQEEKENPLSLLVLNESPDAFKPGLFCNLFFILFLYRIYRILFFITSSVSVDFRSPHNTPASTIEYSLVTIIQLAVNLTAFCQSIRTFRNFKHTLLFPLFLGRNSNCSFSFNKSKKPQI